MDDDHPLKGRFLIEVNVEGLKRPLIEYCLTRNRAFNIVDRYNSLKGMSVTVYDCENGCYIVSDK